MGLEGPWLSTTSTKSRAQKITKARQAELESEWRDRNQRLKTMGLPKESFEQFLDFVYGRSKKEEKKTKLSSSGKTAIKSSPAAKAKHVEKHSGTDGRDYGPTLVSLSDDTRGACASKPSPTYTGEKIIGISVMHKSCLQPIFTKEEAADAASMRR